MIERVLVDEVRTCASTLRELTALGVRLAIDDFGAGASSLAVFREFDADVIKLDRTFARDLASDDGNRAVVRAIVALSHDLGLRVTVEGIETSEQLRAARELGCDSAQGYFLGYPRPIEEVDFGHRLGITQSLAHDKIA